MYVSTFIPYPLCTQVFASSSLFLLFPFNSPLQDALYEIDKEMLYTGDYNMQGKSPVPPVQGGFLVVRPSLETFKEFQAIIRKVGFDRMRSLLLVFSFPLPSSLLACLCLCLSRPLSIHPCLSFPFSLSLPFCLSLSFCVSLCASLSPSLPLSLSHKPTLVFTQSTFYFH